jgi:hypothetical protein
MDNSENSKKISFSVQMTVKELYRFIMYHAYHKFSGILGLLLSAAAFVVLLTSFSDLTEQTRAVLILVAVWFVILDPVILYSRARGQVKRNKAYREPLQYDVTPEGITISQGEQEQTVDWKSLVKIVETKNQFLVYSNPMYAFVFPKTELGEDNSEAFKLAVKEYTKDTRVQLKGELKK